MSRQGGEGNLLALAHRETHCHGWTTPRAHRETSALFPRTWLSERV